MTSTYNEAQTNELADTLNLIRKFADRASARVPERPRRRGRPPVPARDVAKALLLQSVMTYETCMRSLDLAPAYEANDLWVL